MTTSKLMSWFNPDNRPASETLGTMLFLSAAMFMMGGVDKGRIYNDDVLGWVQAAQQSNSYGESDETYKAMKEFEELLREGMD